MFSETKSLGPAWVKEFLLRQESFWDVNDTGMGSWIWRKLLKLRPVARHFIRMEIHNSQTVRFWTDIWHPLGRLIDITGAVGTQKLGVQRSTRVFEVWDGINWNFRRCRDRQLCNMIQQIEQHHLDFDLSTPDVVLWKNSSSDYREWFSAVDTWHLIRHTRPTQEWSKVIWFPQGVPRFSFITWLAVKNRLSTGDRMRTWGHTQGCIFCGEPNETRDHLFFACPYTFTVWIEVVGTLLGRDPDPYWENTLDHLTHHRFDFLTSILIRLVFQVTIYMVWRERNDRKHMKNPRQASQLAKVIDKPVRNRITSTKYTQKPRLRGLLQLWFTAHM
ncbi:uncharacterized protein LOC125608177 [Brassica napus]|uniref:uncharacterized protein LOC125608177 n=1 Tax=Brassica napus TaxID=3708 RepID=UPI002078DB47|nr:uncharacterized protein LOC125608177 [Brassica napus]